MTESTGTTAADPAAERALEKLRVFVASLDDDERAVVAALLAPGVASAYAPPEADVVGFGMTGWSPERLPDTLAARVRAQHVRVEFD
jgi:hypothetical protein